MDQQNNMTDKERQIAYGSLPPSIKESLTPEEKELFLNAKEWPDSLFQKLDEFIIKE